MLFRSEPVLRLGTLMLTRLGCSVSACRSGTETLETFAAAPAEFAAVLIDWQMPGVAGDALVRALRAVRADIPVVVCSGLGEAPSDTPGLRYLAKPFTFQELGAVVDDVRRALPPGAGGA